MLKEEVEEDENAALIRFVNEVIAKAVDDQATDIHFEPLKESWKLKRWGRYESSPDANVDLGLSELTRGFVSSPYSCH